MVTSILATPDVAAAKAAMGPSSLGVALFHQGTQSLPGAGHHLADNFKAGMPKPPSVRAWDFLAICVAAYAVDRFVLRENADDGWTRVLAVQIALADPDPWRPQLAHLAAALRFLTGDIWTLDLVAGGQVPPSFQGSLHDRDGVCLFSGGMDSLLGVVKLLDEGRRPLIASQGFVKEVRYQTDLSSSLGLEQHRFDGRIVERWRQPYEGSQRSRSLVFLAYGVAAAEAIGVTEVFIPENALIAVNPPLTGRRMGSLSTRTTHPHFLGNLGAILQAVGLPHQLTNPFEGVTKGAMLQSCRRHDRAALASSSYSCGKGKRKNAQCGKCVPCLIRQASFHAAQVKDSTPYVPHAIDGLARFVKQGGDAQRYDDVRAMMEATTRSGVLNDAEFEQWVLKAGPLPADPTRRSAILSGVRQGFKEVEAFLGSL